MRKDCRRRPRRRPPSGSRSSSRRRALRCGRRGEPPQAATASSSDHRKRHLSAALLAFPRHWSGTLAARIPRSQRPSPPGGGSPRASFAGMEGAAGTTRKPASSARRPGACPPRFRGSASRSAPPSPSPASLDREVHHGLRVARFVKRHELVAAIDRDRCVSRQAPEAPHHPPGQLLPFASRPGPRSRNRAARRSPATPARGKAALPSPGRDVRAPAPCETPSAVPST